MGGTASGAAGGHDLSAGGDDLSVGGDDLSVGGHDLSAGGDVMDRVAGCAREALRAYGGHPDASVELLNVSENATFLVSDPDAGPSVLRVHRLGYHTEQEIASELTWMDALRAEAGVRTPRVLAAADGRRVVTAAEPGGAAAAARHCVRFEFLPGTEPGGEPEGKLTGRHFTELGEITARMHRHARQWQRPAWFTRFHWDYPAAFGRQARWGRWQDGIGVGRSERQVLTRLDDTLQRRLQAFGQGPERYGLVHADTRLANLLVHDGTVSVIDFDDSGFSWYLYDLGTAVSFFEHSPEVPALVDSWLEGYQQAGRSPPGTGPRSGRSSCSGGCCWSRGSARIRAWTSPSSSAPDTRRGSCDLAESYLSTH